MNTNTSPVAVSDTSNVAVSDTTPGVDSANHPFVGLSNVSTIDQRLAELKAEEQRLLQEREAKAREEEAAMSRRRQEVIATIPGLLGVASIEEAIALMRGSKPPRHTPNAKSKGTRYSEEVRAQARQMMEAGTPIAQIAKHLRIGEATLWIWKASWGLTKRHVAAKRPTPVARKSGPTAVKPLSDAKREKLLAKLREGKVPVVQLAKEFNRSRARLYQIAHTYGVSLERAA